MTTGSGIAVAAMWLAVAIVGSKNPDAAVMLGFMAGVATFFIALFQ